ncbi:MAG: alcohol dehydrogenase catalytic domain-containing protein [Deltaproteobacteria bacterium]|nr:alcohol dehydrogenase catalytic domain-containing protein [Deltaproteobacteria bacterium]
MKAFVVQKPLHFEIEQREVPEPKSTEVLVRIKAAGICGSDLHAFKGHLPVVTYPRVLGHEIAGEVVKVGPDVKQRMPGERVVIEPVVECQSCYSCRIQYPHNCVNLQFRGIHIDGGQQEYVVIPEKKAYPVPQDMAFSTAALAEPLGIGLESAKTACLIPGDTVAILGAGPIGLACLIAVKANGHRAIVTDVLDPCLERAKALGADVVVNIKREDMVNSIMEFTDNKGANVIMECAAAGTNFNPMLEASSVCGRIVLVGLIFDKVSYSPYIQVRKHIHLLGTRNSNMIPQAIRMLAEKGKMIENVLVTHRIPFPKVDQGYDIMTNPAEDSCKIILTFPS